MSKKIVLKVCVNCDKCKTTIMKTTGKICGIKSLALDAEKSTLTVIGEVDVVQIVKELKKVKKPAEVISVGPEKEEKKDEKKVEKKDEKKDEKDEKKVCNPLPPCCGPCRSTGYMHMMILDEPPNGCIIL